MKHINIFPPDHLTSGTAQYTEGMGGCEKIEISSADDNNEYCVITMQGGNKIIYAMMPYIYELPSPVKK